VGHEPSEVEFELSIQEIKLSWRAYTKTPSGCMAMFPGPVDRAPAGGGMIVSSDRVVVSITATDRSLAEKLSKASEDKYGFAPKPEDYQKGNVFVFRPGVVLAWKQFPKDATRWQF
jgi:hypothetical protein